MNKKPIIFFVSYFSGIDFNCPAIWAEDKLHALEKLGYKIIFISGYGSKKINSNNIIHLRIPSFSYIDFKIECDFREMNGNLNKDYFYYFWFFISNTIGRLLDIFLFIVLRNKNGGGKWSWVLSSFIPILGLIMFKKPLKIFTTGGAASANLITSLAGFLTFNKVYVELQDPLSGPGVGRSSTSKFFLAMIEKLILIFCYRLFFVTKSACNGSRKRNPKYVNKIKYLYPGSRDFNIPKEQISLKKNNKIVFVHAGTLYGSRNLSNFFIAIDKLIDINFLHEKELEVINIGAAYIDNNKYSHIRKYFVIKKPLERRELIRYLAGIDYALVVQHHDDFSRDTIPYKTYDYLNVGVKIFGLTNNKELNLLLEKNGNITANILSVSDIVSKLKSIIIKKRNNDDDNSLEKTSIVIEKQLTKLLKD